MKLQSPLKGIAEAVAIDLIKGGMDSQVVPLFSKPYVGSGWDKTIEL